MPHTKEIHNDVYCSSQFCIYWGTYLVIYNYCLCLCIWRPNVSWYFELSSSCSLNIDFSILRQRWYRGSIIERIGDSVGISSLGFNSSCKSVEYGARCSAVKCKALHCSAEFDLQHKSIVPKSVVKYRGGVHTRDCYSFFWQRRASERSAVDRDKLHRRGGREGGVRWEC